MCCCSSIIRNISQDAEAKKGAGKGGNKSWRQLYAVDPELQDVVFEVYCRTPRKNTFHSCNSPTVNMSIYSCENPFLHSHPYIIHLRNVVPLPHNRKERRAAIRNHNRNRFRYKPFSSKRSYNLSFDIKDKLVLEGIEPNPGPPTDETKKPKSYVPVVYITSLSLRGN